MADNKSFANDLKLDKPEPKSEPKPEPEKHESSVRVKMEGLIHKHFPERAHGGVEAHQPLRRFLLELAQIF